LVVASGLLLLLFLGKFRLLMVMGSEPLLLVVPTTQAADEEESLMLQALTSHPTNHAPHHQPLTLASRPKLTWTGTVSDSLAPQLLPQRILGPLTLPVLTRNASAAPIHHAQDCSACAWSPPSCATPWGCPCNLPGPPTCPSPCVHPS